MQYLGNCLDRLLSDECVTNGRTTNDVLCILKKYIESFDEHWPCEKQQSHFDKCINEIKNIVVDDTLTTDAETCSAINNAFDVLETTLATAVEDNHVEVQGYQMISSALLQLRQTVIKLFARINNDNKNLKTTLTNLEARFTSLEKDSLAVKKANFIADLMAPLVDKIMDEMEKNSIDWYWYSSRELNRLKHLIDRNSNWINSHRIGAIINDTASKYGLAPSVLVDLLQIKQDRNHLTHYTQKIRNFALKSNKFSLSDFIMEHVELQVISEFEKTILQPVFANVCKEFLTTEGL